MIEGIIHGPRHRPLSGRQGSDGTTLAELGRPPRTMVRTYA
jgi:hypothetical protein